MRTRVYVHYIVNSRRVLSESTFELSRLQEGFAKPVARGEFVIRMAGRVGRMRHFAKILHEPLRSGINYVLGTVQDMMCTLLLLTPGQGGRT